MPANELQANGGNKSGRDTVIAAVITGVFLVLVTLIGVFGNPLADRWFVNKPPVPGAPTTRYEPRVVADGYVLNTLVEVSNHAVDPLRLYQPLNTEEALSVRPGDTLYFSLSCSITPNDGNANLVQLLLALPRGLKIVEEPRVITTTGRDRKATLVLDGLAWTWIDPDLPARDTARASFTATVSADKSNYLTATWGCPASTPNQKIVPGLSRAVLKVEPN